MTRRASVPLVAVGAILAIAILHAAGALRPVEDLLRAAFLPAARVFSLAGASVGGRLAPHASVATLEERVKDLEARLASVSVDYVQLKALEEENASLRKLAGFLDAGAYDHVSAQVISRTTDRQTATLLIDRGATDGVETGMAVIAEGGVFVGKVTSLREHVSVVTLVSDASSRLAASVAGRPGLIGLVQGEGSGVARLTLVPQSVALTPNQIIVTAGTEEKVPPNLAIGLVNDIEGTPTDPFRSTSLQPLAETVNLVHVSVLRPAALRPAH